AQRVAVVFSVEVSFPKARQLLPALPQEMPVLSEPPAFDLVSSRRRSGWARAFSLPGRRCLAFLPQSASARVPAQRLPSAQWRQLMNSIQFSSFSVSGFESSRRSEIDPEDSPKSPPVLASSAHRRTKRPHTQ